MSLKLHYLQHVPFEDLANIETWAKGKGHKISKTQFFSGQPLPDTNEFDWLVVMGGPMNIYEEQKYPWLVDEKKFIEKAIKDRKVVLGICLGAQLIADVLGGSVYKNRYAEIGWFPVSLTGEARETALFQTLPNEFITFQWHGDTFDIPPGCRKIAENDICANQAFEYNEHVVGLQFHLESSPRSIERLIRNCADEIVDGKYIQTAEEMRGQTGYMTEINRTLALLLGNMEKIG